MSRLCLVVPDFPSRAATDAVPRLPALEILLARGRRLPLPTGWRQWLLGHAGLAVSRPLSVARMMAGRPGHFVVATPVHLLAGLEQVHLDPAGPLQLEADDWSVLAAGFNDVFAGDGLRLEPAGGLGLLSLPRPVRAQLHDPEPLAGREAGAWLPDGEDGPWLRRLMTEIQMWLHELPLNRRREAAGERPVNALWPWGAGEDPIECDGRELPPLASRDAFLVRLWRESGGPGPEEPADLRDLLARGAPLSLASVSLYRLAAAPADALGVLEERWFRPLAAALASGRLKRAELLLGEALLQLRPGQRLRFWRRAKPWQEALA